MNNREYPTRDGSGQEEERPMIDERWPFAEPLSQVLDIDTWSCEGRFYVYRDLETFYKADERRRRSGEADYGVWWMGAPTGSGRYRVSYVHATGEVYAVRLTGRNSPRPDQSRGVEVLGVVPPDDERNYYRSLDAILEGWPERCGKPCGLQWVREKLKPYRRDN